MKKKTIEKIPYLGLPKVKRSRMVRYVGVTALKNVAHEGHFFLEVYRNDKARKDVPVARIVVAGDDFGTYFPKTGEWSRQKCEISGGFVWDEENDERIHKGYNILKEENVLYSQEDRDRIEEYFSGIGIWNKEWWWEYIFRRQKDIVMEEAHKRTERRNERRQQALKERMDATPELPEASILAYADQWIFRNEHYLYYKKKGRRATVACSACGGVSEGKWKAGEAYEGSFEKTIQEPVHGCSGVCPMCGAAGVYKAQGKMRSHYESTSHVFLGQRYKDTGMVIRYVLVAKKYELEMTCGESGLEMYGAREELSGVEIARTYFEEGKKHQTDYHKHDPYAGRDFWDDCNLSGLANITIKEARIMPETYGNMKGTFLQYSAMKEYQEAAGDIDPVNYLVRYLQTPQIEMLVKLNLIKVVQELVKCYYGIVINENAKRPDEFLGIRKERVRMLMEEQGDLDLLKILQMEKREGQTWTDGQVRALAETGLDSMQLLLAMQHMTVQKLLNRIQKYAGCGFGTGCGNAMGRLRQTAQFYLDYLDMRQQLGYSLDNAIYQQPRDLSAAHDRMVYESNKKEQDKRLKEVAGRFPLIRKHYRRFRKQYFYEDETYQIRPARSAEEIVMEGRLLHHCVGGDSYLSGHNRGNSIILMLRFREDPETPYITVEMEKGFHIRQWYGAHDKKPDKENMQRWLDAYVIRLKSGNMAAGMGADPEEAAVSIAVTA